MIEAITLIKKYKKNKTTVAVLNLVESGKVKLEIKSASQSQRMQ